MGTRLGLFVGWERRMGGNNSTERKPKGVAMGLLTYDQLRELADQYQVPSGDVMTAHERFKMLDINCDDYVTMDDFSETFYLASDVYVPTIYAHMLQNGKVSFHTFLDTVLKFHPSRPLEDRCRLCLRFWTRTETRSSTSLTSSSCSRDSTRTSRARNSRLLLSSSPRCCPKSLETSSHAVPLSVSSKTSLA